MKKNIISFVVFLSFLISCGEKEKTVFSSDLQAINLKELEQSRITSEDVVNSIHFVKLETTNDCLIGQIIQIGQHEDKFYILDKTETLWMFDDKGNYIKQIGRKGPGPEEFASADAFYIHPNKKYICVLSILGKQAVRYSMDGEFLERLALNISKKVLFSNFNLADDNTLLVESSNSERYIYQYASLTEADMSEQGYHLPYGAVGSENCSIHGLTYPRVGKNYYTTALYNDTIYKWQDTKFVPAFIFESGLKHPNPEVLKKYGPYEMIYDAEYKLWDNGFNSGPDRVFSTDKYLYIEYIGLGYYNAVFWELPNKKGKLFRIERSDNPLLHVYLELMGTSKDHLIKVLTVDEMLFSEKEIKKYPHPEIPELYKRTKEDDNPILVLYNYDKLMNPHDEN